MLKDGCTSENLCTHWVQRTNKSFNAVCPKDFCGAPFNQKNYSVDSHTLAGSATFLKSPFMAFSP